VILQRALQDPASLSPDTALLLQRTHGNRFVRQLVRGGMAAQPLQREEALQEEAPDEEEGLVQKSSGAQSRCVPGVTCDEDENEQ